MYSKDDEEITFAQNFVAEGQVELWLKQLEAKMRSTLYEILVDARRVGHTQPWLWHDLPSMSGCSTCFGVVNR